MTNDQKLPQIHSSFVIAHRIK